MDLKLLKMFCKDSKQHHVMFHELYSISSLLCIARNVRFEIPYKVLYFETPFLMIFKYYACASYDTTHKIEREFYYRNFQSGFFRLNVELNTKTKKNDEIELFYYFLVCGAKYIYTEKTSRSFTYERPRC